MKLDIKMLDSDSTLNNLIYQEQTEIYSGETATIMFQLVNERTGIRYIPGASATLTVKMHSVNDANTLTKTANTPFPEDRSIWSFSLNTNETQKLAGVNMELTLIDGTTTKKIWAHSVLVVMPKSPYQA